MGDAVTLSQLFTALSSQGIELAIHGDQLRFRPVEAMTDDLKEAIRNHRPEVFNIVNRQHVGDVGRCEACGGELIGFPTFDKYINRTCPDCGLWYTCVSSPAKSPNNKAIKAKEDQGNIGFESEPAVQLC